MPYYTIGYEGAKLDGFILCLKQHGIQVLADVREKPYSRKPGFSQRALRDAVSSHGIRYQYFQKLGCPPDIRNAYQEDGDWGRYRAAFNRYLTSNLDAVKELVLFTRAFPCALMCFEADPNRCHRLLIAQQIEKIYHEPIRNLYPADVTRQIVLFEKAVPCTA